MCTVAPMYFYPYFGVYRCKVKKRVFAYEKPTSKNMGHTMRMKIKGAIRNLRILEVGLKYRGRLSAEEIAALLDLRYDAKKPSLTGAREKAQHSLVEKRLLARWSPECVNLHYTPTGDDLRSWLQYVLAPKNGKKG